MKRAETDASALQAVVPVRVPRSVVYVLVTVTFPLYWGSNKDDS